MANPKNRQEVEEALRLELERDRTKTYVVEISPLGLVEMTRQNVTDGPREILTTRCLACEGDGIVVSEETHAVEAERQLRRLAASSKSESFLVELPSAVAGLLIGPAGSRLAEIERETGRTYAFETHDDLPADHLRVVAEGSAAKVVPTSLPVSVGQELELELLESHKHHPDDAIGRIDGYVIAVAGAAGRVGETVTARIERATRTVAYAVLAGEVTEVEAPVDTGTMVEQDDDGAIVKAPPARKRPARRPRAPAVARRRRRWRRSSRALQSRTPSVSPQAPTAGLKASRPRRRSERAAARAAAVVARRRLPRVRARTVRGPRPQPRMQRRLSLKIKRAATELHRSRLRKRRRPRPRRSGHAGARAVAVDARSPRDPRRREGRRRWMQAGQWTQTQARMEPERTDRRPR